MRFRLHMLFKHFRQGGLPLRAAVFACDAGHGRCAASFILGLALATALCAALLPSAPAQAKSSAEIGATHPPISEGLELMQLGISNNMCALTFDDGPSPYTAQLLDTLKEYNVPATFFVVGTQVRRRPDMIRRMLSEGHEVGNHSYSHAALRKQSPESQQADLLKLDAMLRELGASPRFVRPPFGFYDHNTINVVQEMDGHIVMWTVDSQDWRNYSDLDNVLANMQLPYSGAPLRGVFLFHDTHLPTVERMPEILDALTASGCRFVTLSEYIDAPHGGQDIPPILEARPNPTEPPINFARDGRLDAPGIAAAPGAAADGSVTAGPTKGAAPEATATGLAKTATAKAALSEAVSVNSAPAETAAPKALVQ